MKKLSITLGLIAMLVCSCASPIGTAGKLLKTSQKTVDAAMQGWATYVVLAKPPVMQEEKVRSALTRYQQCMMVAKVAYANAFNAPTDQTALDTAITVLTETESELLGLITSFAGKVQKPT